MTELTFISQKFYFPLPGPFTYGVRKISAYFNKLPGTGYVREQ
jgi:hypothetical protein